MLFNSLTLQKNRNMNTKKSFIYLSVTLGLLSAFGPFIIDLYLPSLPSLADYFNTSTSLSQLSLSFSMFGLAFGQILIGPLSDKYGRKRPLLLAMLLFLISTVACLFSWNIYSFLVFRLLQGIAGAGGVVLSKSVSTDLYTGRDLAKFMALIGAINGIAPVCAPVVGGLLMSITNWRGIFCVLLGIGFLISCLCFGLGESLPKEKRDGKSIYRTFKSIGTVFHNNTFMFYTLQQTLALGAMFVYIAASPFIIQVHYGYSPLVFSICFGINALGIGFGSVYSLRFHQSRNSVLAGSIGLVFFAMFTALNLMLDAPFLCFETGLFFLLTFMGMTLPASTALALDSERDNAGAAAAVLGAMSFLVGGACAPLVGIGNILHSTALLILITTIGSLGFSIYGGKRLCYQAVIDKKES
jgi:MFS transporter, DHA1 family, multidrug resistance protein